MIYGDERNINAVVIASVTEAPKHVDGIGIKETHINEQGHLIITYTDGRVADAGEVVKASAVAPIVNNWLDEHPEATTTVEDGSITETKIDPLFLPVIKTTIDNTLSMSGAAAEAEAVGDEVERLDGRIDSSVHTTAQTLTDTQKAQARSNIGALTVESGTTAVSAGTWKWRKYSDGFVECSMYYTGSMTARNVSGGIYYSNIYTWDFPFKLSQLQTFNGVVGKLGDICNPSTSGLFTDEKTVGFRVKFPTERVSEENSMIITISGWLA